MLVSSPTRTNVLLVGPYSYVGGVSVHMKRLIHTLTESFGFGVLDDSPVPISDSPYNIRRFRSFCRNVKYIRKHHIVHVHTGNWMLRVGVVLLSLAMRRRVIVTLHSFRLKGFSRRITQATLKHVDYVICVNEVIFRSVDAKNKVVREAFIPPVQMEGRLPPELDAYVRANDDRLILCANAFRLSEYQGNDLYGLDQCIDVAGLAKSNGDNMVIIFVVGRVDAGDSLYFSAVEEISRRGLSDYIHVVPYSIDFIALIRRSDIVLRPTLTDGDALTVREAIFFGKPVIASDVIGRPKGTELYRAGDARDLYKVIKRVRSAHPQRSSYVSAQSQGGIEPYQRFYADIYTKCIDGLSHEVG